MKIQPLAFVMVLTLAILPGASRAGAKATSTLQPNAALSYWQAFALIPEMSKADEKIVRKWGQDVPLDAKAKPLIDKCAPALEMLHHGAKQENCDWGLALEMGSDMPLAHLNRARNLAQLAALRARYRSRHGDAKGTVEDLLAAFTLGGHVGMGGGVISHLVNVAIQAIAVSTAADCLPQLGEKELNALSAGLPEAYSLAQVMLTEKTMCFDRQLGLVAEKIKGQTYEFAEKAIADLAKGFEAAWPGFVAKHETSSPLMGMVPGLRRLRIVQAKAKAQMGLLKAGIEIRLKGEKKISDMQSEFVDGGFEYRKLEDGFELKTRRLFDGKPETILIRQAHK